ncbi:hypothetical protein RLEG12_18370 [Rhizobium leguminosarum bv. trifolii CB782]|uniref:Uncharacterized protein n=1 Tax=Rhizobium hidalgonense TaxID=1538159 RepID=A0ABX4JTW8_9HYPH|nr:hypothetical protein [Rhizobium hidalgonense]AHG45084.1 hypothetical protein RLEG12_18370 [Rhizobium leguminosarum bv. trifolii CB782]EJC72927.1 hypothetical protein Rleg10DRAFT_1367 [Rhizobium leguminosarum bv. trifolii WSM2012]MDR9805178.1 hypothetical protein [Rhizobium hidalgonense]MDR9809596.1 hypothetical protein [Rhizobium hidalgonense]PDT22353.1 hypothetical protein CO674_17340 [Rhizobium hidalgonense]
MSKSLIAASLLAIGMASSAFAQSNPDPIGPTNGGSTDPSSGTYSSDYTNSDNGMYPVRTAPVDPMTTQSIGQPQTMECPGMPQQRSGVDTRGGESGASISEACREYDN